jgi:hypothetical protein
MGGLGGRLVDGVLADHRENGIGVQVVQSRYGLEGGSPRGRYSRRMSESTNIIGRWRITEMDNWDQEAVDLVQPGFIEFDDDGLGSLGFIVVTGELDCREADRDGRPGAEFSWQGSDEGDEVSGRGWAALNPDGTLEGHIYFHLGDDSAFRAERFSGVIQ